MSTEHIDLVADIGATNARFALVIDGEYRHIKVLQCSEYVDLAVAASDYLRSVGGGKPQRAAIAVATPVINDAIRFTNNGWSFSISQTRKQLQLERLLIINDFTALALSLPALKANDVQQIGGVKPIANSAIALLGAGSGLGVSGLLPAPDALWVPIQGEGGHVTVTALDQRQFDIFKCIAQQFSHASVERILSGPGLVNLYKAICELDGKPDAMLKNSEITQYGVANTCAICREVLAIFCQQFGLVAGNLALTMGARGGVYIGGGIVPKISDYFLQSGFRKAFENKGRFTNYLEQIPCYLIQAEYPALTGCMLALDYAGLPLGCESAVD